MKKLVSLITVILSWYHVCAQVDTTFIYRADAPYGTLDIRISKSSTRYYYLEENKTFSFRESSTGVRTNTYRDMTSWDSQPYTQGNLREKIGTADNFIMNYRLLFPVNYNASYAEGYPMIVMVHGAGERGNCWEMDCYWGDRTWNPSTNSPAAPTSSTSSLLNNDHNLLHGGSVHLDARNLAGSRLPNDPGMPSRAFPGFVLFPQNLNGWGANPAQDVIRIVRLLTKKYKIDQNRIYIHGLSNGGQGTYEIIKRAPWLFAAALPMSAANDGSVIANGLAPKIASIPLWLFQGGTDTNPTPTKTEGYVKKFREAGANVRYSKYENLGHGVWNTAYNEPDFFSWMLLNTKARIHVPGNLAAICKTTNQGIKLELPEGHFAYQWERNGAIIPDATSAVYVADTQGVYRARFSRISITPNENQWGKWSAPVTVTEQNPSPASVVQKGTLLLRDLNSYNTAHLKAAGDFAHYYWYKDGVQLNLPDTVRNLNVSSGTCTGLPSCVGNGVYTLVTSGFDNCPSPVSEPKHIFFSNQAPVNIGAVSNFDGTASSAGAASLSWTDNSTSENGFEIWRRKVTSPSTFSPWYLATLSGRDVSVFFDTGLEPSSTYQYKIRAVGNLGRSDYTPAASDQFLTLTTPADNQAPTAPQNLITTQTDIREITLTWQPSTDNTGIREYFIFYGSDTVKTGSPATTRKLTGLPLNTVYNFTVKAVDFGGNVGPSSNAASANTYTSGLYYKHSTGAWTDLDQINWANAEFKGKVANFTLAPRTQEDFFNFEFTGYLYIERPGPYRFRITSDDGSRLYLNSAVIADNDGVHGSLTITSAELSLNSGPQFINVKFFEYTAGQSLSVQYRGRDTRNNWINIPNAALKSGTPPFSSSTISNTLAAIDETTPSTQENSREQLSAEIYPNPSASTNNIGLNIQTVSADPVHLSIRNLYGEEFYDGVYSSEALADDIDLPTTGKLSNGIYLLIITQGGSSISRRLIIKD